jgi:hypothetical protein
MTPLSRRTIGDLILRKRPPKAIRTYTGRVAEFARDCNA